MQFSDWHVPKFFSQALQDQLEILQMLDAEKDAYTSRAESSDIKGKGVVTSSASTSDSLQHGKTEDTTDA